MPTTTTPISRANLQEPDLNHDGGALLHSRVTTLRTLLGDHLASRYVEFTAIADSGTVEFDHGLGANLEQLDVILHAGTGDTKSIILDTVAAGWTIQEKAGDEKTILEFIAPGAGGPHNLSVVILDAAATPHLVSQLLAAAPSNPISGTVKTWWDSNKRGLCKDNTGMVGTLQTPTPMHVSSNFNALPGNHYIVDTSGGAVTATMPSSIEDYDVIQFSDSKKSFNANNLTLDRNTNDIDGDTADFVFNSPGDGGIFVGDNTASNWVRASSGGASGGSGSGFTNYFENADFENDIATGVSTGGGTAPTTSAETSSALFGSQSLKATSGAGTGYVDLNITGIDNAVLDGGILLGLTAYLRTDATSVDDDWTAGIYNVTDAAYEVAIPQTNLQGDTQTVFRGTFVPLSGKAYVLRVEFTDTTASKEVDVDGLLLTPDSTTALTSVTTEWQQYTPVTQGFGTINTVELWWRQVGESVEVQGSFVAGAVTADLAHLGLPNNWNVADSGGQNQIVGECVANYSTNTVHTNILARDTHTYVRFSRTTGGSSDQTVPMNANAQFSSGRHSVKFMVRVLELTGQKTHLITPNLLKSNARAVFGISNTSFISTAQATFTTTPVFATDGFATKSGDATKIVIPVDGLYRIDVTLDCDLGGTPSTGADSFFFSHNSRTYKTSKTQSTQTQQKVVGSWVIDMLAGDEVYLQNNTDQTVNAIADTVSNIALTRVQEIGAHEPVGFGTATEDTYGLVLLPTQPNLLINGDFGIAQRTNDRINTAATYQCPDRWRFDGGIANSRVRQIALGSGDISDISFNYPEFYLNIETTANQHELHQRIEDVRTLQDADATLSFWVKRASGTGSYNANVAQAFGSGGSSTVTAFSSTYTPTSIWQKIVITGRMPSISGKTIGTDSHIVVQVTSGTGLSQNVQFAAIKFEASSSVTPFIRHAPSFQGEFAACERYYEDSTDNGVAPNTVAERSVQVTLMHSGNNQYYIPFSTDKRATPTLTFHNPNTGAAGQARNDSALIDVVANTTVLKENGFTMHIIGGASAEGQQISTNWAADSEL